MSLPPRPSSDAFSKSRVLEVLFNRQAQSLIASGAILAALLWWGTGFAPASLALAGRLVALLFGLAGATAAGISLSVQARGGASESASDTLSSTRRALPCALGVALPLAASAVLVIVVSAIMLALCRLPYVGPVLLAFGIPAMAILLIASVFALALWWLIAAPATWNGLDAIAAHCATLALLRGCRRPLLSRLADSLGRALIIGLLLSVGLGLALALLVSLVLGALGGFAGAGFLALHAATPAALHGAALGLDVVVAVLLAELSLLPSMAGVLAWLEFSPRLDRVAVQRDADAIRSALHLSSKPVPLSDTVLLDASPALPGADSEGGLKPGLEKLPAALGEVRTAPLSALFVGVLAALIAVGAGAWLMLSNGTPETLPAPAPAQSAAPIAQSAPVLSAPLPSISEPALRLVTPHKARPKPEQSTEEESSDSEPADDSTAKDSHTSDEGH